MNTDMEPEALSRGRTPAATLTPITTPSTTRSPSRSSRPKVYKCDYEGCDKAYSRPSLLTQHQRTHTDSRPFSCEICGSAFFRESHLKRHMLSHQEDKPFKCSVCGKGVNTRQHLKRHEVTHTKSFKCPHEGCGESFYKHQQLRHHQQSVHLKTLSCKECGKTFPRPYRLANHIARHHGASPAYQCDFPGCMGTFKTWSALQLHTRTEHPKIICEVCGKGCVGQEGLRMHMLIHDESKVTKKWKCTECPMDFAKKDELLKHCDSAHKFIPHGVQPTEQLSSDKLNKLVTTGSAIDLLFNTVASPQKTIPCTYKNCTRTFKKDYDLQRHLQWHDKQRELYAARGLLLVSGADSSNVDEQINAEDSYHSL